MGFDLACIMFFSCVLVNGKRMGCLLLIFSDFVSIKCIVSSTVLGIINRVNFGLWIPPPFPDLEQFRYGSFSSFSVLCILRLFSTYSLHRILAFLSCRGRGVVVANNFALGS